jgi:hypothetical protein
VTDKKFNHERVVKGVEVPIKRVVAAPDGSSIIHLGTHAAEGNAKDGTPFYVFNTGGSVGVTIGVKNTVTYIVDVRDVVAAVMRAHAENLPHAEE